MHELVPIAGLHLTGGDVPLEAEEHRGLGVFQDDSPGTALRPEFEDEISVLPRAA